MKRAFLVILAFGVGCAHPSRKASIPVLDELERWEVVSPAPAGQRFDPSGIWIEDGRILVVSDRREFRDIYRLEGGENGAMAAKVFIELKGELPGTDFEGLARCGSRYLIVEERSQSLLEVENDGTVRARLLDLEAPHRKARMAPASGTRNGGLEGVACAPDGRVYVANERQFRMIYEIDPQSGEAKDFFDVPAGPSTPRWEGKTAIWPDFADLFYEGGYLYALQRNDQLILKIDPASKRLAGQARLPVRGGDLYDTEEPYGLAEGIFLDSGKIYILIDNNGVPLRSDPANKNAVLFVFKRPLGF